MREVRIKDTLSGELTALDPARPRSASTPAGRPSTAASTSATPAPSSSSRCSPASCAREGYATKLVVNVTDINDKIYTAAAEAGEPSAEFAARMTSAYVEDTDRLGLGRPDAEPLASETDRRHRRPDRRAGRAAATPTSPGGDVYFRVASFEGYGKLSNRRPEDMDQGEEAGRRVAEGEPARLRPLEIPQGGRGHELGLALGPRAPRLAHRVLGDGRAGAGPLVRDPRRRLGPGLPPPRERDRPVRGRGPSASPASGCTTG